MALSLNGSTGISGINGSAGTPALQGGDADTGIFFGTDTASIATAGSQRLIVDASGNINIDSGGVYYDAANNRLGVGTTSPRGLLHVGPDLASGATDAAVINLKQTALTASDGIYLERPGERRGYSIFMGAPNDGLTFTAKNFGTSTTAMYLDREGRVGVGTTAPEEILHVAAVSENVSSRDGVMLESTSALAADTGLPLVFSADIGGGFTNYGLASIAGRKENATSADAAGYLQFATGSSGGAISEKARITSGGEFLVGRTNEANLNVKIACANASIGAHYIGMVHDSTNSNNRTTLVHRMDSGSSQGFMFSGNLVVQSYTGNAFITVHVTKRYSDSSTEVDIIHATHSAQISRANVRVVTALYGSARYLGFQKNGGGTGVMYINAFMNGNIDQHGGVREVSNTSLGSVTEIATLNY